MNLHDERAKKIEEILGPKVTTGNSVEILVNGDQIFPAMLKAIREAKKSIHFLTYVYWSGDIAVEFAEAITERANAGVECYVLLDALGAHRMDQKLRDMMSNAGAHLFYYNRITAGNLLKYYYRTHRKILVTDGKIGFSGGVGIADEWAGDARNEDEWHEFHFRATGPVVAQIFNAFAENWNEIDGIEKKFEFLDPEDGDYPVMPMAEGEPNSGSFQNQEMQSFYSSPRDGHFEAYRLYKSAVESAQKNLYIENAYFVPNAEMRELLSAAVDRGVDVKIILPDFKNDSWIARCRSRPLWGELLESGVEVYRYTPTMTHSKFMIMDDDWVTAGSVNFDTISFKVNEEANLNLFGDDFAARMHELFDYDLSRSRKVELERWRNRGFWRKLEEWLARLAPAPA